MKTDKQHLIYLTSSVDHSYLWEKNDILVAEYQQTKLIF